MSEYAALAVGEHDFLFSRNCLGSNLLIVFNRSDKQVKKYIDEDGEERTLYCFKTSVKKAKQCLDVLGYTLSKAKSLFNEYRGEMESEFEYRFEDNYEELYSKFSYETWSKSIVDVAKDLIEEGTNYDILEESLKIINKEKDYAKYLIIDSIVDFNSELYFGMPYEMDPWYTIRIIFESLNDETEVILDYTCLVDGGRYNPEDEVESFYDQKIIVMTEGKTDSKIISKSLEILYPHLRQYYYFMDFDISNAQGSTNFLTHYIKAFIGAGIESRIIALFDNDAAAKNEIINFQRICIPDNIRVLTLPDIELANNYPTIGPYGNQNASINGLACSIELFLGRNILTKDNGELIPVIWKGYVDRINKYQGEIINKDAVQQKFFETIEQIENGSLPIEAQDWSSMEKLLQTIFNVFND